MRIIAGEYRGRKIKQPVTQVVRPTKDRIREAVFNLIAGAWSGGKVLDVFAGSGAYGLEALSRGAESAVFIDNDQTAINTIKENIDILGPSAASTVNRQDAFKAIKELSRSGELFNVVFCDPPYGTGLVRKILNTIINYDIVSRPGLFVLEHHASEVIPEETGVFSLFKQKTYKDITITVLCKN